MDRTMTSTRAFADTVRMLRLVADWKGQSIADVLDGLVKAELHLRSGGLLLGPHGWVVACAS